MSRRRTWLAASLVALAIAVAGIVSQGLNLGIEFTGGRTLDYSTSRGGQRRRGARRDRGGGLPRGRRAGRRHRRHHRPHRRHSPTRRRTGSRRPLAEIGGEVTQEDDQQIGASLGEELRDKALLAFGIALLAQMIYLAIRFKWTFGVAAVLAMFHDVVLVVGLFAWLGKPIDGVFLAAALTIVGLSVNDTVVVFDRIRERWRASRDKSFIEVANRACIETMPRTVNTGLGAMFILAALAILGGDSLQDFAIALLVGLVVGTYSSVFTATPLLTYLQERSPMSREEKVKQARGPGGLRRGRLTPHRCLSASRRDSPEIRSSHAATWSRTQSGSVRACSRSAQPMALRSQNDGSSRLASTTSVSSPVSVVGAVPQLGQHGRTPQPAGRRRRPRPGPPGWPPAGGRAARRRPGGWRRGRRGPTTPRSRPGAGAGRATATSCHGRATRCRASAIAAYRSSRWVAPSHSSRTSRSQAARSAGAYAARCGRSTRPQLGRGDPVEGHLRAHVRLLPRGPVGVAGRGQVGPDPLRQPRGGHGWGW